MTSRRRRLCSVRLMRAGFETAGSCWWVQRLFNMSTVSREWVALQHAHLMPFADSLLRCVCGGGGGLAVGGLSFGNHLIGGKAR
jgi:hypothetical protein